MTLDKLLHAGWGVDLKCKTKIRKVIRRLQSRNAAPSPHYALFSVRPSVRCTDVAMILGLCGL